MKQKSFSNYLLLTCATCAMAPLALNAALPDAAQKKVRFLLPFQGLEALKEFLGNEIKNLRGRNPASPVPLAEDVRIQLRYMSNQLTNLDDNLKNEIWNAIELNIDQLNSMINSLLGPNPVRNYFQTLEFLYRKFQFLLESKNYQISAERRKTLALRFSSSKIQSMSSSLQALWNKLSDLNGDLQRLKNVIKKIKNLENQLARLRRNSKVSPQQNNQMDTRLQKVMLALGKAKNSRDIQNMGTEVRKINDQLKAMEENSPAEKKPATPPTVNKPHSPHSREDKSRKPSFPNQGIGWFSPSSDSESNSKPHSPHPREDKSRKFSFPNQGIGWFSPSSDSKPESKPHSPHPREDKSRKFSFPNQGVGWFSPSSDSKPDSKPHIPIHGRTIHILFKR